MPVTRENLETVMDHAQPDVEQTTRINIIERDARKFAATILTNTDPCGDQQAAIRKVREATWTARQAILLKGLV